MVDTCDNKSVGVIIENKDSFAVIRRRNYPIAHAFIAGHLDGDAPEKAAVKEAQEEVDILITESTLELHERFPNPCKRTGGLWHEWFVYKAVRWHGNIKAGSDAKEAFWMPHDDLRKLAGKTRTLAEEFNISTNDIAHLTTRIVDHPAWQEDPGLEPIWLIILERLTIV